MCVLGFEVIDNPEKKKTGVCTSFLILTSACVLIIIILIIAAPYCNPNNHLKVGPDPKMCSVNAIFQTWSLSRLLSNPWEIID